MSRIKGIDDFHVAMSPNAEYTYIRENKDVWFIDYVIGIAFKTPIDFTTSDRDDAVNIGLLKSGSPFKEFHDIKDFQDYMEEKIGQEIVIESSIDPVTNIERDDMRIIWNVIIY